jgi:hypothetical protein
MRTGTGVIFGNVITTGFMIFGNDQSVSVIWSQTKLAFDATNG